MSRMTAKLLGAMLVLGSGASAMANDQAAGNKPCCPGQNPTSYQNQANQPPPTGAQPQSERGDVAETFAAETGRSHLGILILDLTPELRQHFGAPPDRGVLIGKIEPNSAASRAGLQVGDVLVRVGPRPVHNPDDVIEALAAHEGGRIRLIALRQGRPMRLEAMLPQTQQQPPMQQPPMQQPPMKQPPMQPQPQPQPQPPPQQQPQQQPPPQPQQQPQPMPQQSTQGQEQL